jgi:8-oxo-dGTP diphosphatase
LYRFSGFSYEKGPQTRLNKLWGLLFLLIGVLMVAIVEAIIKDKNDKVLLLQRSDKNKHYLGKWQLPGGKVDSGETVEEAIQREVFEETGFYCSELEVKKEVCFLSEIAGVEKEVCLTVFYCRVDGDFALSEDHNKSSFFEKDKIDKSNLTPESKKSIFD